MSTRHNTIGIKQVVRLEWYDLTLNLLLEHQNAKDIRQELVHLLRDRLQTGGFGERGTATSHMAVTQLMQCWVAPDATLCGLRDRALALAGQHNGRERLPLHWAMTIAAYPFWHSIATLTGRLLQLQTQVTQAQIRTRCYEAFGERSTIERSVRRVLRSFVAWNVLQDAAKGCYVRQTSHHIMDANVAALLVEATLHASPSGAMPLSALKNDPALFPFVLPNFDANLQSLQSIEYSRYGQDHEMVRLVSTKV